MTCKGCVSNKQSLLNGEIAIHFPGLKGLNKPIVWVFPKLAVCLECGFTAFTLPETELGMIVKGAAVEGAVILDEKRLSEKRSGAN
jgi:hypothetical protein